MAQAPALPPPAPFPEAVERAGEKLFVDAAGVLGADERDFVIDPLIDASTGAQTTGTVQMGEQLAAIVRSKYPQWKVKPLTRQLVASGPLLLMGTLTAVNTRNATQERSDAFRIWLTLVDLKTGRIVAKKLDRATVDSVDASPTRYYQDSPTWHKDRTVSGYINSCQVNSKVGDPIDPTYLMRLPGAALTNEAVLAYQAGKTQEANALYRQARELADPGDLRVLNGLYLTNWQLGKKQEAAEAFGQIVGAGIAAKRLPMKLLFRPGTTQLVATAGLQDQYDIWLREVARQTGQRGACLAVIGHTSKTGTDAINDPLSKNRAAAIKGSLERQDGSLVRRLTSDGVGSRENLIGLGTDDVRDALDRRVEFKVVDCAAI